MAGRWILTHFTISHNTFLHTFTHKYTHIKINKDEYCGPCKKKFNMHRINFKTIETKKAFDTKEKKITWTHHKKRLRGMREEQGILIKISTVTKSLGQMWLGHFFTLHINEFLEMFFFIHIPEILCIYVNIKYEFKKSNFYTFFLCKWQGKWKGIIWAQIITANYVSPRKLAWKLNSPKIYFDLLLVMPGLTAPVLSALIGRKVSSALVLSTVIGRGWFLLQKCCDWLALVTEIGLFSLNNIWIFRMQMCECVCVCVCVCMCA